MRAADPGPAIACGRNPDEITLISVGKTFPAETVNQAVLAGATDLGEISFADRVVSSTLNGTPGVFPPYDDALLILGPPDTFHISLPANAPASLTVAGYDGVDPYATGGSTERITDESRLPAVQVRRTGAP